jgi:hypothetical protein
MPSCIARTSSAGTMGRYRLNRLLFAAFLAGIVSQSFGAFVGLQHYSRKKTFSSSLEASSLSSEEVRSRLISQLEKLRHKDRQAKVVSREVSLVGSKNDFVLDAE